jgi:hypothetical protein
MKKLENLFVAAMCGLVIWAVFFYWGFDKVWYATEYYVSPNAVVIEPQPIDCDFWTAPVGNKGCHYDEKAIPAITPEDRNGKPPSVVVIWVKQSD